MPKQNTPMICGGVYEIIDGSGRKLQAVLQSITEIDGTRKGSLRFCGFAEEHVLDGSDRWAQFTLIGRPASPNVGRPKKKA